MLRRVALTGPDGVLGRHMASLLERRNIAVVRLGRAQWNLGKWIEPENLDKIAGLVDAIFHFGAITPKGENASAIADLMDANVRACAAIGTWAAKRDIPLIYSASAGVYVSSQRSAKEDAPQSACPRGGLYGLSKLLGERLLQGLTAQGLRLCSLRITSLYGAGMHRDKLVAKWLSAAERDDKIVVQSPSNDAVNLVHAVDVARAALQAAEAGAWDCFNIAGPALITMAELAQTCVRVAGRGAVSGQDTPETRPAARHFDVSSAKAAAVFGYKPALSLSEGLNLMRMGSYG